MSVYLHDVAVFRLGVKVIQGPLSASLLLDSLPAGQWQGRALATTLGGDIGYLRGSKLLATRVFASLERPMCGRQRPLVGDTSRSHCLHMLAGRIPSKDVPEPSCKCPEATHCKQPGCRGGDNPLTSLSRCCEAYPIARVITYALHITLEGYLGFAAGNLHRLV